MSEKARVVPKAVYIGLGTFTVLYFVFVVAGNLFTESESTAPLMLSQLALFTVSGFVAGRIAGVSGWLNGVIVGLGVPFVLAIGLSVLTLEASVAADVFTVLVPFWLVQSVVCCGVGGFVADLMRGISKRDL